MIDLHLFDREGNPLPGAAPCTLHVEGPNQLTGAQIAAIDSQFRKFATAYRLGLSRSRRGSYRIDASTILDLSVNQGVFSAIARTGVQPQRNYFGGLVLRLERLTVAGQAYLEDHPQGDFPEPEQRETIPFTLAGPPAVAGSLGEGATEWLLMQIARNGDLTDRPVRNGLVRLHRIANPLIGDIASHNYADPRGYVMTADWASADGMHRATAFYLCGRNTGIPPAPQSSRPYSVDMVRMYHFGFDVEDFAAPEFVGMVLLVWWDRVFLFRTGGAWTEIGTGALNPTDVTNGTVQPFGYDFEVSDGGGSIRLTCSGTNTDGECSSFDVNIGQFSATASIAFRSREHLVAPDPPATSPAVITGSWTVTTDQIAPVHVPGAPGFDETYVFADGAFKQTSLSITDSGLFSFGAAATRDPMIGGVLLPARGARGYTLSAARGTDQTNVAEYVHSYALDYLGNNVALPHYGFDQPYSATASITLFGTILGDISYTWSSASDGELDATVVNGTIGGPVGIVQSLYADRTWAASFPLSGTVTSTLVRDYPAMDKHRKRIAWRHDAQRTATWEADLDSGDANGFLSGTSGPASYTCRLVNRAQATLAERASFLQSFNGAVTYAGSYSFSDVPAFCAVDYASVPFEPTRPDNVNIYEALFNTRIERGIAGLSGIDGFWKQEYLAHFNDLGTERTNYNVPDGSGPPSHSNVFAPDVGTWNVAFNAATPPTFNLAGYESLSPNSAIDVVPAPGFDWTAIPSTTLSLISSLRLPDDFAAYYNSAPVAQQPAVELVDDRVYVDPRTDGYVAQSFWDGEMEAGGDNHASMQTFVGNDDSVTTLVAILNEAAALAGMESEYDNVFIRLETAKDVALI